MQHAARYGLAPEQFWALTYYELALYINGRAEAARDELRLLAIHAAWTLMPYGKVRPSQLMREESQVISAAECGSQAELEARIAALRAEVREDL